MTTIEQPSPAVLAIAERVLEELEAALDRHDVDQWVDDWARGAAQL